MNRDRFLFLIRTALIAALYFVLTVALAPISYGPVQVRVSEALNILPIFYVEAVPGLFIGCLLANMFGGFGIIDIVFGSLLTLIAAVLTRWLRTRTFFAFLSPVLVNGFGVPAYLTLFFDMPYLVMAAYVTAGEAVAVFGIGFLLFYALKRRSSVNI